MDDLKIWYDTAGLVLWVVSIVVAVREFRRAQRDRATTHFATESALGSIKARTLAAFPIQDAALSRPVPATAFGDADNEAIRDVRAILGHYEELAVSIAADVIDEDLAFELVGARTVAWVSRFREFIEDRQKQQEPRPYRYAHWLADRWEKRLAAEQGKAQPLFLRRAWWQRLGR